MDGQTDGDDYNIPFAFLKNCGDNNQFRIGTIKHNIAKKIV